MKRMISFVLVAMAAVMVLDGCASTKQPVSTMEEVSQPEVENVGGPVGLIEHKGTAWGLAMPEWVGLAMQSSTSQKSLKKILDIEDKKIWVLTKNGPNLDFLQTWVDQVDARAEIAASIRQSVGDAVTASMKGASESDIEKALERYSQRAASVSLVGLGKEADWWTKTRQVKMGVATPQSESDYVTQYSYMVIYAMDEALLRQQLKDAMEDDGPDPLYDAIAENVMEATKINTPDAE